MTLLYIDTNIFISAIREEKNKFGNDISTPASKIFFDAMLCKYHLMISQWTATEMRRKMPPENVRMALELIKKKLITLRFDEDDLTMARRRSKDNTPDALHIILAEKANADYIITRDLDDFMKIGTRIPIRKPEHL